MEILLLKKLIVILSLFLVFVQGVEKDLKPLELAPVVTVSSSASLVFVER